MRANTAYTDKKLVSNKLAKRRAKIAADTNAFLVGGGVIDVVPILIRGEKGCLTCGAEIKKQSQQWNRRGYCSSKCFQVFLKNK